MAEKALQYLMKNTKGEENDKNNTELMDIVNFQPSEQSIYNMVKRKVSKSLSKSTGRSRKSAAQIMPKPRQVGQASRSHSRTTSRSGRHKSRSKPLKNTVNGLL